MGPHFSAVIFNVGHPLFFMQTMLLIKTHLHHNLLKLNITPTAYVMI